MCKYNFTKSNKICKNGSPWIYYYNMLKSANMSMCIGQMCFYVKNRTENGKKKFADNAWLGP